MEQPPKLEIWADFFLSTEEFFWSPDLPHKIKENNHQLNFFGVALLYNVAVISLVSHDTIYCKEEESKCLLTSVLATEILSNCAQRDKASKLHDFYDNTHQDYKATEKGKG